MIRIVDVDGDIFYVQAYQIKSITNNTMGADRCAVIVEMSPGDVRPLFVPGDVDEVARSFEQSGAPGMKTFLPA